MFMKGKTQHNYFPCSANKMAKITTLSFCTGIVAIVSHITVYDRIFLLLNFKFAQRLDLQLKHQQN